jgi:hypothetical protein
MPNLTDDQLETLNTGRAFASLEGSKPYRALMARIAGFVDDATARAQAARKDFSTGTDAYVRMSITRDVATELYGDITSWVKDIKQQAADLAEQLKQENE